MKLESGKSLWRRKFSMVRVCPSPTTVCLAASAAKRMYADHGRAVVCCRSYRLIVSAKLVEGQNPKHTFQSASHGVSLKLIKLRHDIDRGLSDGFLAPRSS